MQPAGGIILPSTQVQSSTSGRTSSDFTRCGFGVKMQNEEAAGASSKR